MTAVLKNATITDLRPIYLTSKQNIADSTPVQQIPSIEEILTTCCMHLILKQVLIKGVTNSTTKIIITWYDLSFNKNSYK